MSQKQINLYTIPRQQLFSSVKEAFPASEYDFKKHSVIIQNKQHDTLANIRLPLHLQINDRLEVLQEEAVVIYLSIEAGKASLQVQIGLKNVYHTTFSAYMTRKKQGFSQIKYLNKKGKSRAGSRVRLKSTEDFFEQINTALTELLEKYEVDRIAVSCSATLWPYLFQAKVECPVEKSDERWYRIPLHIPQSNYTQLAAGIKKLKAPLLFYDEKQEEELRPILIEIEWLKS